MDRRAFCQLGGVGIIGASVPDLFALDLYNENEHIKDQLFLPSPHHNHYISHDPKPLEDVILIFSNF